jgi:predicted membrane-bound spermidine synthase
MKGYRKFVLGLVYLVSVVSLAHRLIGLGITDFTSLGIFAAGLASGLGVVVWGNVQNHRTDTTTPPGGTP